MVTLNDIAKATGYSLSTTSIVLRGKAEERNISDKTKNTILEAAQKLGYRANVAARRLRANTDDSVVVSVFMALDKRSNIMLRLLMGLQKAAEECSQPVEIMIHSYKSGELASMAEKIALTGCAIICNASDDDMRFLENTQFAIPVVLFLRASTKYCCVNTSMTEIGKLAANIFAERKCKRAVILRTESYYSGLDYSRNKFAAVAEEHGMTTAHIYETHDIDGGYRGGIAIREMQPLPDCVFCTSDNMALGLIYALKEIDIKIPEQIEIISSGIDNPEFLKYSNPPVSAINVPIDVMARECINLLFLQLGGKIDTPQTVEVPFEYVARESCEAV